MAKPFDATLNVLLDSAPEEWAAFLAARTGVPFGPVEVLDTDLSLSVQADKVFALGKPAHAIIHLELEVSSHLHIPLDLLRYNVLLHHQHMLPVQSVLVLLRPKANASDQSGFYEVRGPAGSAYLRFQYTVIRVWEEQPEVFLAAGKRLAPLSMLTDAAARNLPEALCRLRDSLQVAATDDKLEREMLSSTFVLLGMRYTEEQIVDMYRSLSMKLEESTTYQWILRQGHQQGKIEGREAGREEGREEGRVIGREEGRLREAKLTLLRLGTKRFGPPGSSIEAQVNQIGSLGQLESLLDAVLDAKDWAELMAKG